MISEALREIEPHLKYSASSSSDISSSTSESNELFYTEVIPFFESHHIQKEWLKLAETAIEPNPFYGPEYLTALVEHVCVNETHFLVLIWSETRRRELLGLFPVTKKGIRQGFPIAVTCLSFHSLIGVCTPLISHKDSRKVFECFFKAILSHSELPNILYMPEFYINGAVGEVLKETIKLNQLLLIVMKEFSRAAAFCDSDFATYSSRWRRKKARHIRSREKKLKSQGTLSFEIIDQLNPNYKQAYEAVLALENSGWKGKKGTALVSQSPTKSFADFAFHSTINGPSTHVALLRFDGRVIAGQLNLISQNKAFFIKSAYDEELASFGPGIILYKWVLEQMLDQGRYVELDSCADAHHHLEEIWLERKIVQELFLTVPGKVNERKLKFLVLWRDFFHKSKRFLKN